MTNTKDRTRSAIICLILIYVKDALSIPPVTTVTNERDSILKLAKKNPSNRIIGF